MIGRVVRSASSQPRALRSSKRFQSSLANAARSPSSAKAYPWLALVAAATIGYQSLSSKVALDEHHEDKLGKSLKTIEASQIAQHTTSESCWIVIDGLVWDVTEWLEAHPGGNELILEHAGKDVT